MKRDNRSTAEAFAQLALALHGEDTVDETIDRVLKFALGATGADHAGVILVHSRKRLVTAAATDTVVASVDAIQMEIGEGPDLEVLDDRISLIVSDTKLETRWPTWARLVADAGIQSLLSVRLYTSGETVGTLNLYADRADAFDDDDQAVAHILARHAAVALAGALKTENLWKAVDARKRIGQAQGILMERFDLTSDQAFMVLMRYSQHNNMKLRAVADELIATRVLPSGPPPRAQQRAPTGEQE